MTTEQRRIPQDLALIERLRRERDAARQTLRAITEIPPGSQGAYSKFRQAQNFAQEALKR